MIPFLVLSCGFRFFPHGCPTSDDQPFTHEQMLPPEAEIATTPAILRRSYSIARGKSTEVQSIYPIDQEMLWLRVLVRELSCYLDGDHLSRRR
jgi:hypothetical protein